jgi:hypothetical protein
MSDKPEADPLLYAVATLSIIAIVWLACVTWYLVALSTEGMAL